MNLFLHGINDFTIVNDDTLARPAFTENGRLKQFDMILANPPYSISQWDREAFTSDKYGCNFLGVPPQGRADYAFIQHILASLKPDKGRCAILLPHGVLFRAEESRIREQLVKSDKVECVIGLAGNLFYNSPMEACIMVCRMRKPPEHVGRILFINAVNEVTRRNAQSWLDDVHIERIAAAYDDHRTEEEFSRALSIDEIAENNYSLNIVLYVRESAGNEYALSSEEYCGEWLIASDYVRGEYMRLNAMLDGRNYDEIPV